MRVGRMLNKPRLGISYYLLWLQTGRCGVCLILYEVVKRCKKGFYAVRI